MSSSLLPFTSAFISFPSKLKTRTNQTNGFKVSCNVAKSEDDHKNENKLILPETQKLILPGNVDRRNLLVGLGGLYTAVNLSALPSALAAPITAPDITSACKDATSGYKVEAAVRTQKCCPPNLGKPVKTFVFPKEKTLRMRWPAHKGTKEQVEKYKKAMAAMRALPDDHPHSFKQQASIHCAYCNGGYTQVDSGFPDIDIQIHNSWLFYPFHRWYLYFYERILGNLINDPTFALPYWNWDDPAGMEIPEIFLGDESNPLYDVYRDAKHKPPLLVDLAFQGIDKDPNIDQIQCNLYTVYRDLVRNAGDVISFFGGEYVAGDNPFGFADSIGSVESGTHTAVHRWVGDSSRPNGEDMGNFYSTGYDPLFYVHHTNCDRMWKLWKNLPLPGRVEPTSADWLNASYVFYDENQDLVRVYNKDSVDMRRMGFDYAKSDGELAWSKSRPPKRNKKTQVATIPLGDVKSLDKVKFPFKLDKILKVRVKRPVVNRTENEKKKSKELLLINGIKYNGDKFVKFDVFVNDKVNTGTNTFPTPCDPEYAGGFAQVPHGGGRMKKMLMSSAARFGLDELLEDTNTEGDPYAVVALVPRTGTEDLTIKEIKIKLVPIG